MKLLWFLWDTLYYLLPFNVFDTSSILKLMWQKMETVKNFSFF